MYSSESDSIHKEYISLCKEYRILPFQDMDEIELRINNVSAEISGSGYFEEPSIYRFPWKQQYNIEGFVGLIKTGNGFLALSESEQDDIVMELTNIISKNGGYITLNYICTLFLSAKKD